MAKKEEKTEVAVAEKHEVGMPIDYADFAGQGMEGGDAGDYAIPFVMILQKLSPQIDELEGAKAGLIIETATNEMYQSISVIPCYFRKDLVEWKPRESGGGFVKAHGWNQALLEQCQRNDRGQMVLPNGNILVDTKYHYILIVTAAGTKQAVISMTSTQLKKSRKWMTMMSMHKLKRADGTAYVAPSFAFSYKLGTIKEENEKGQWFGWTIEQGPAVEHREIVKEAISFHRAIQRGDVKTQDPDAALKDDIPF